MQPGTSFRLVEVDTQEERTSGLLHPREPEATTLVRGKSLLESNAIENLAVRIDGVPFRSPDDTFGRAPVELPDPATVPPPLPAKSVAPKKAR